MQDWFRDLRYAVRTLRTHAGVTTVAILSLGLGIGVNSAIFSLMDAVILRPLPVRHPEELLQVTLDKPQGPWMSNPIWEQIRDRQDVFSGAFAYGRWRFNLAPGGEARYVQGHYVSGRFFETLGVRPAMGRMLGPSDDRPGCAGAAVVSYRLWQSDYGGRPDILRKTISLNGHPIEIVGVSEAGFTGLDVGISVGVMVPLCAEDVIRVFPANLLRMTSLPTATSIYGWLKVIGRLKSGAEAGQASARLNMLAPEILQATLPRHWPAEEQARYRLRSFLTRPTGNGQSDFRTQYGPALGILMAISGLVLLITCANVASLLLARGVAREREMAIRMALGAGRGRLIRQMLTETLLLSAAGTVAGVMFAAWGVPLLVRFLDVFLDLRPDGRVLAFYAGIATATGLLAGLAPAWHGTRVSPQQAMQAGARGSAYSAGAKFGLRQGLVVVQVALAGWLLVGAALMVSTFWKLRAVDPGFRPEGVLLARVDFRNGDPSRERRVWEMLDRLRGVTGVQAASISSVKPLCGCDVREKLVIEGYTPKLPGDREVSHEEVSEGYFQTVGMEMVAGRDFAVQDGPRSRPVAIISESMGRKFFGSANPLGRFYRMPEGLEPGEPTEIVGVVKDTKVISLREGDVPAVYTSRRQDTWPDSYYEFELRAAHGDAGALAGGVTSAVRAVDPDAILEFSTLSKRVSDSMDREQLLATISGFFGVLALALSTIGLYGMMSYHVARRRKEIGIRMALGAEAGDVIRLVMGEAGILVGIGLAVGLGAALATTRFVASFLYGLKADDPVTFAGAISLVAAVGGLASYVQGLRAARVAVGAALREE